jgi:hypothetical protein
MKPIPALKSLANLAGRWETVLRWSEETHELVGGPREIEGEAVFEWLESGRFLHYQFGPSDWIIGRDDSSPEFSILYSDDRGVSRVYRMTLARGVWRIWRNAPGFYQRFEGRFTDKGNTIRAHWERSVRGRSWIHDFDLTFRKSSPRNR